MKRTVLVLTLITVLFFLEVVSAQLEIARANPSPSPLQVFIDSPTSYGKNSNSVWLNISIIVFHDTLEGSENRWIAYSLDGQDNVSMAPNYQGVSLFDGYPGSLATAETALWLPDGLHDITVYAKYNYGGWISESNSSVEFVVGASTNPNPQITKLISPPFIIMLVMCLTFSATIIGLGLLVYFKKRKH
jgi:hypothetical protein